MVAKLAARDGKVSAQGHKVENPYEKVKGPDIQSFSTMTQESIPVGYWGMLFQSL